MRKRGMDAPADAPPAVSHDAEFFLVAYTHLQTCRSPGFGALGPVPWTAVMEYCRVTGYSNWEFLFAVVGRVDGMLAQDEEAKK